MDPAARCHRARQRTHGRHLRQLADPQARRPHAAAAALRARPPEPAVVGDFSVVPAQQRILDALVVLKQIGLPDPDKTQLALFAGTKPTSGGYKNNLGRLRSLGLIDYPVSVYVAALPVLFLKEGA